MPKGKRGGKLSGSSAGSAGQDDTSNKKKPITQQEAAKYKKISQAVDYIKDQVGVDITKYHNSAAQNFEKRGQYTIDFSEMSRNEQNQMITALNQKYSPYKGSLSGTWIFTITKNN